MMMQQFCTVVQAGLNAFEANEFGDLVGQLSSSCVAGLDPELVGDREGHLKELGSGSSSPDPSRDSATSKEDAAASPETVEVEAGEASEDEDARRAKPTWNAKIINGSGWRVGLNGRKIYIEYELFNIFSPIGALLQVFTVNAPISMQTSRCHHGGCLCCHFEAVQSSLLFFCEPRSDE
jgi:hypothetical protein